MGIGLCGLVQHRPSPRRALSEIETEKIKCRPTASVMKCCFRPRSCSNTDEVVRKNPFQELQICKSKKPFKDMTLKDLMINSPGFDSEDAHHGLKASSRKIHPSFDREEKQESFLPESLKKLVKNIDKGKQVPSSKKYSFFCRGTKSACELKKNRARELKKQVSFKSPVAEVFEISVEIVS